MCAFRPTLMQRGGSKAFLDFVSKLPKGLSPQERAAKYREIHGPSTNTSTNQINTSSLYRAFLKKTKGQLLNISCRHRCAALRRRFYALSQQEMEEVKAIQMLPYKRKRKKKPSYGSRAEFQDFVRLHYPMAVGVTHQEKMRHVGEAWKSKVVKMPRKTQEAISSSSLR